MKIKIIFIFLIVWLIVGCTTPKFIVYNEPNDTDIAYLVYPGEPIITEISGYEEQIRVVSKRVSKRNTTFRPVIKKELIYVGYSDGIIYTLYREYNDRGNELFNNLYIKPDYTVEYKYNVQDGYIQYKQSRIIILDVASYFLKYKVKKYGM
jgi:hypothetical protein